MCASLCSEVHVRDIAVRNRQLLSKDMHILLHHIYTLKTLELSRIDFTNFTKHSTIQ